MADEIKRVIEVDASASAKTVRDLMKEVEALKNKLRELEAGTAEYAATAAKAEKAEKELSSVFEITRVTEKDRLATVEELAAAEKRDAEAIDKLVDALRQMSAAGQNVSGSLHGLTQSTDEGARTTQQLDGAVIDLQRSGGDLINQMISEQAELKSLAKQRKDLEKAIKDGIIADSTAREIKGELIAQENVHKTRLSETRSMLNSMSKSVVAADGSYKQMSQTLGQLRDQFRSLNREQRESAMGLELTKQIQALDSQLKQLDGSIGNYQRNVGGYTKALDKLKGGFGKIAMAVGAAIAVFKAAKSIIKSTQTTGDAWAIAVAGWKSQWEVLKKSIATGEWDGLIKRLRDANEAGRNLAATLDSVFERQNSINLQTSAMARENAELEITLRDVTKTYDERLTAGNKLLENEKTIATQQIDLNRRVRDAQLESLFALTNTRKFASDEEKKAAQEAFAEQIKIYNINNKSVELVQELIQKQEDLEAAKKSVNRATSAMDAIALTVISGEEEAQQNLNNTFAKLKAIAGDNTEALIAFVKQYNLTNDAQVDGFVKAQIALDNATAAELQNNKRIISSIHSVEKARDDAAKNASAKATKAAKESADATKKAAEDTLKMQQATRAKTEENEVKTAMENYQRDLDNFNKTVREKGIDEEAAAQYREALAEQTEANIFEIRQKYREKEHEELMKYITEVEDEDSRRSSQTVDTLNRNMSDLDRNAARESLDAEATIKDPKQLENALQDIQQRLYERKIALIDEALESGNLEFEEAVRLSNLKADLEIENERRVHAYKKKNEEEEKKNAKKLRDFKLNIAQSTLNSLASIIGEETAAGKAAAVASATIDTYKAANAAYSSMAGIPMVGPELGAAAAAAAIVAGIANVKKILETQPSGAGLGAAGGSTPSVPAIVQPPAVIRQVPVMRSLTSASEEERLNRMASDQRVYLVYSDVEQAGRQVRVQQEETTF